MVMVTVMAVGTVYYNSGNMWPTTLLVPMADITNQSQFFQMNLTQELALLNMASQAASSD